MTKSIATTQTASSGGRKLHTKSVIIELVISALLLGIFAGSVLWYRQKQQNYLTQYSFRLAAEMGDNLNQTLASLELAVDSAARKALEKNDHPAAEASLRSSFSLIQPRINLLGSVLLTDDSDTNVVPQFLADNLGIAALPPGDFAATRSVIKAGASGPSLLLSYALKANGKLLGLKATAPAINFFAGVLSEHHFDDVLLADQNGVVLFQLNPGELRIGRLPGLKVEDKIDAAEAATNLWAMATSQTEWSSGSAKYVFFLQPFWHAGLSEGLLASTNSSWLVCGVMRQDHFGAKVSALPHVVLLYGFFAVGVALALWPFLNRQFASPRDPLRPAEALLLAASSVLLCVLMDLLALEVFTYNGLEEQLKTGLREEAGKIAQNLTTELRRIGRQMASFNAAALAATNSGCQGFHAVPDAQLSAGGNDFWATLKRTNLLHQYPGLFIGPAHADSRAGVGSDGYPYLYYVWWADPAGKQLFKWTVSSNLTPPGRFTERPFFRRIVDGQPWPKNDFMETPFYVQPLFSSTRNEQAVLFSVPVADWPWFECTNAACSNYTAGTRPAIAAMELQLQSLTDIVLPLGYGFCVVDESGAVLFHSDKRRNLRENFFTECEDEPWVKSAVATRVTYDHEVQYRRRLYDAHIRPLPGLPWSLIVFRDEEVLGSVNRHMLAMAGIFIGIYLAAGLLMIGSMFVFSCWRKGSASAWLWPQPGATARYLAVILTVAVLVLGLAGVWLWLGELALLSAGILLPAAGLLAWRLMFCAALNARDSNWIRRKIAGGCELVLNLTRKLMPDAGLNRLGVNGLPRVYVLSLGAILFLTATVVTSVAFKLAYDQEMALFVKGTQLQFSADYRARQDRLHQQWQQQPPNFSRERRRETLDCVYDFFLPQRSATTLAAVPSSFERDYREIRPQFAMADVGLSGMLQSPEDGAWRWRQGRGVALDFPIVNGGVAETNSITNSVPTIFDAVLAQESGFPTLAHGILLVLGVLALPLLLAWFLARKVFLVDFDRAASPESEAPSAEVKAWMASSAPVSDPVRERMVLWARIEAKRFQGDAVNFGLSNSGEVEDLVGKFCACCRGIWAHCSPAEKCALYQVARFGLLGNLHRELQSLRHLNLVRLDPRPRLLSRSFAEFILAAYPEDEEQWAASEPGKPRTNAWTTAKLPLVLLLVLSLGYVFFTQPTAWNNAYAWLTGLAAGLGLVAKVTSFFGGRRSGSSAEKEE